MIKYNNKHWFKFLFSRSGYFHDEIWLSIAFYTALVTALTWVYHEFEFKIFDLPSTFHTVLGLVIGLLLVFRTNTAYDRWWEGRKQLGALVNTIRHIAIKSKHYLDDEQVMGLIKLYSPVLKNHLRESTFTDYELVPKQFLATFKQAKHQPNFVLNAISSALIESYKLEKISGEQLIILEDEVSNLLDIQGACERIKNTPIPFGYTIHLKRILLIYLLTLPFGFIKTMGWYNIPFMLMVFYTMIGIELIGEEIEEPFGTDLNDLPFDELVDKISSNIEEIKLF